ncbi:hypothetical protein LUX39_25885 [Actinomadura madurae]|nr:hypothetical protein [Actinomadura madurae]MCP9968095.1 hypothetical protein [Actinomadura madurae]MCQ0016757.1 hypothetical protein [Actinomadura madurae]
MRSSSASPCRTSRPVAAIACSSASIGMASPGLAQGRTSSTMPGRYSSDRSMSLMVRAGLPSMRLPLWSGASTWVPQWVFISVSQSSPQPSWFGRCSGGQPKMSVIRSLPSPPGRR